MKKSLTINATRDGKKVSKSLGYVNPDVANSIVGGFAQMVNALSNDTFVNAEVVKKMDTSEEEQQGGGGGGSTTAKLEPTLTIEYNSSTGEGSYTYDGDGEIFGYAAHKNNGSPYPLTIDRTNKTFSVTTGTGDPVPALVLSVALHATEGENYAAKTAYFEGTVTPPGN